ncbi:MAG: DNA polymerase III subunit gamma/tau [Cyanobacteriota bacterium]
MSQAYQPLHHKYRPQRFDQLVGQEAIATTLSQALRQNRIAPAYLLSGPRGTGKTSSARILARSLNCLSSDGPTPEPCGTCELCRTIASGQALDVIEIDAASNTGVDNIRDLIERSRFAPVQARWKVYVIDECHMLSTAAFNALRKTLEEPPPRVVFVLATTDPQRVLPTILSRCQRFDFRRIPLEALEGHLRFIAEQEEIGITADALHVVAQRAQGGLRDAESLLDQLSLLPPPIEALAVWELLGAVPEQELLTLAGALATAEPLALLECCRQLLDRGREPSAVLQGLASLLRDLVLAAVAPDRLELTSLSPQFRDNLPALAGSIGKERLLLWQSQLRGSEQQRRQSVQPRLWLDVLLLGLLAPTAAPQTAGASVVTMPAAAQPQQRPADGAAPMQGPPGISSAPGRGPVSHHPAAPDSRRQTAATAGPTATANQPTAPAAPAIPDAPSVPTSAGSEPSLNELWQQILSGLELPSTRMLLSQQATLIRLDSQRAVVRVSSNWIPMVQSRLSLLETAVGRALGSPRQLVLEGGDPISLQPSPPASSQQPAHVQAPAVAPSVQSRPVAPTPHAPVRATSEQEERPETQAAIQRTAPPKPTHTPAAAGAASAPTPEAQKPAATDPEPETPTPGQPARTAGAPGPGPSTPEARQQQQLDEKARRLADFFNGEVITLEDTLEDGDAA